MRKVRFVKLKVIAIYVFYYFLVQNKLQCDCLYTILLKYSTQTSNDRKNKYTEYNIVHIIFKKYKYAFFNLQALYVYAYVFLII